MGVAQSYNTRHKIDFNQPEFKDSEKEKEKEKEEIEQIKKITADTQKLIEIILNNEPDHKICR